MTFLKIVANIFSVLVLLHFPGRAQHITETPTHFQIETDVYHAMVAKKDGCLESLKFGKQQFFDAGTGISRGCYLWRNNTVLSCDQVKRLDDRTVICTGESCELTYSFSEKGVTLTLANMSSTSTSAVIVFSKAIEAVSNGRDDVQRLPTNQTWKQSRLLTKSGVLSINDGTRLFGPWGNGNQVWLLSMGADTRREFSLLHDTLTSAEKAFLAGDERKVADTERVRASNVRIELETGYQSKVPGFVKTEDAAVEGLQAIYYEGPIYRGFLTKVFAYYGVPKVSPGEKVPAMILVHGGVGTAYADWVQLWVDRGYAALAMDLCGSIPVRVEGTANRWQRLKEGAGPPGWEASFGQLAEPVSDQWPSYAVNAIARARTLLGSFPQVDEARIGLTGISWGGYLTCITIGLDQRYQFAVPVYGCGFLNYSAWASKLNHAKGRKWLSQFDPSLYLPKATMPVLWVTGTNDPFYPLASLRDSYMQVQSTAAVAIKGKMVHSQKAGAEPEEIHVYAESMLKGGDPLLFISHASADISGIVHGSYVGSISGAELMVVSNTDLHYDKWNWKHYPAHIHHKNKQINAELPDGAKWWFLNVTDERGLSTSSLPMEVR